MNLHDVNKMIASPSQMRTIFIQVANEPTPCENCYHASTCKEKELSCEAFKQYANTGKIKPLPRVPSDVLYYRLFKTEIKL